MTVARGRFIVLEGIDGAGTTTQSRRLVDGIRQAGLRAHLTREPSDGPIGVLIRQILQGRIVARPGNGAAEPVDGASVALLFAADRLDHLQGEIGPLLEAGVHVVSDRYVLSSLAYQSLEAPVSWVKTINARARRADLTVFVDVPAKVALGRRADRAAEERFESLPFQQRVARAYRRIIRSTPELGKVVTLDGQPEEDAVAMGVWAAVAPVLGLRSR
jgi:dTMP kinase